ncbi:hypothetical protein J9332_16620 [Aquimarina celericrescens]|nr:hypothetical protein [Aquimarina celericrescens]
MSAEEKRKNVVKSIKRKGNPIARDVPNYKLIGFNFYHRKNEHVLKHARFLLSDQIRIDFIKYDNYHHLDWVQIIVLLLFWYTNHL